MNDEDPKLIQVNKLDPRILRLHAQQMKQNQHRLISKVQARVRGWLVRQRLNSSEAKLVTIFSVT